MVAVLAVRGLGRLNEGSATRRKPAVGYRMHGRSFPDRSLEGVVGSEETNAR